MRFIKPWLELRAVMSSDAPYREPSHPKARHIPIAISSIYGISIILYSIFYVLVDVVLNIFGSIIII